MTHLKEADMIIHVHYEPKGALTKGCGSRTSLVDYGLADID
jgi:hypothetical protein